MDIITTVKQRRLFVILNANKDEKVTKESLIELGGDDSCLRNLQAVVWKDAKSGPTPSLLTAMWTVSGIPRAHHVQCALSASVVCARARTYS